MIPYSRQGISTKDIRTVASTLRSDFLTTGPKVEQFEQKLAQAAGFADAVVFSSGTAALHGAMFAINLQPYDEVIVSALTFVATANAVIYQGGIPIIADVEPETLLIDIEDVQRKITGKTRAIVSMDYAGRLCRYDKFLSLADDYRLWYISDSCHSLGARSNYRYNYMYARPHLATYSFHPTKAITTGEGGAVATSVVNKEIVNRLRCFRNHGRDEDGDIVDLGFNYRLSDIQCALGISQLDKLEQNIQKCNEIARRYDEAFKGLQGLEPLPASEDEHAYHLYVVQTDRRDKLRTYLKDQGIETQIHYKPLTLQPWYQQNLGVKQGDCPAAESEWERIVSIPCYPAMTKKEISKVIEAVKGAMLDN